MATKKIAFVTHPQETHWVGDGFRMHNFIPSVLGMSMQEMDPFLLLDYNAKMEVPPSDEPRGVGVHPHRGFETVTIAYSGQIEHGDSAGHGGVIGEGDVQWMTAASGVLHKEFYAKAWAQQGGTFQMVQLWTNLPAKDKKSPPKYQSIAHSQMGRYPLGDGTSFVEVIAGNYKGTRGPASTHTPIAMMNAKLEAGARADFSFPAHYNTLALVVQGSALVNGEEVPTDNIVKFENDGEDFVIEATESGTIVLVLSGEPIGEPIVSYGPFVMNTKQEIMQALADVQQGKFGHLA